MGLWRGVVGTAAVAVTYVAVRSGRAEQVDGAVASAVGRPLGMRVDRAMGATTDLGSVYGLAGTSLVLAATGRRRAALDVAGSGAFAWVIAQAIKPLLRRPRPYEQEHGAARLVATPAGSSWPSGHTAVATAIAVSAADHGGVAATAVGTGLTGFVAASRVYVGVHHATDTAAGIGVGLLASALWRGVLGVLGVLSRR